MFKEMVYMAVGLSKRIDKIVNSIIEEGKKEVEDKGVIELTKEHLNKRKEMVKGMLKEDVEEVIKEFGLATKQDIEELKNLIKQTKAG